MPLGPASRNLRQTITYWAPSARTEWGQTGFQAPVKIRGRWTEAGETVRLNTGEEYVSKAVVFTDRTVLSEGYLALGDFTAQTSPHGVSEASEIKAFRATPDLRNLEQERKAYL